MTFSECERRLLLSSPGIGEAVVKRLERAGFTSFAALRQEGASGAVESVVQQGATPAWRNRRRALERALRWVDETAAAG